MRAPPRRGPPPLTVDTFWILDECEAPLTRMRYRTKRNWRGTHHSGAQARGGGQAPGAADVIEWHGRLSGRLSGGTTPKVITSAGDELLGAESLESLDQALTPASVPGGSLSPPILFFFA